jgi:hypothetical protein
VSNSGPAEPSATLERYPATGRVSSYRRFALLPPTRELSQKADVKAGKGLMSPSGAVHCDARMSRIALCITPAVARAALGARLRLSQGKVILMTQSLVARRDTCMVVLARRESAA